MVIGANPVIVDMLQGSEHEGLEKLENECNHHIVAQADPLLHLEQYDIVVANILAGTIMDLAPTPDRHLAPSGILILSGILVAQAARVQASFAQYNLTLSRREEWACLCGLRIAS